MKVRTRSWIDVEVGNDFIKRELESYGISLPINREEFKFNGEPDSRRGFVRKCTEVLKKARTFFVLVIDGIDIPEENICDYQQFFQLILKREKLPVLFFTSDVVLRGGDIFDDFRNKLKAKKNIALYSDERLQPGTFYGEPFGLGGSETIYLKRFVSSENKLVFMKP